MSHGPRRPGFYLGVLAVGFVVGGLLQAFLRRFLPQGPAKEVFTWSVTPTIGPVHLDLLVMSITLGPIGLDVSLLAVVGVVIAYLVARSLFSERRTMFGNLGFTEIAILVLTLVLFFGAKRIPESGSSIGKGIKEFNRGLKDVASSESAPPVAPP